MLRLAVIEIHALPWRPRMRVMSPDRLRNTLDLDLVDGLEGLVVSLVLAILIFVFAPLIVLVLAALLFSFELPIALLLAVLIVVARFSGLIPWTVLTIDTVTGEESRTRYRNLLNAVAEVREVNQDRKVRVRWRWV